jgi:hypothetical protein
MQMTIKMRSEKWFKSWPFWAFPAADSLRTLHSMGEQLCGFPILEIEPEFRGDGNFPAEGRKSFTHQFLIDERSIDFGGVEQVHTQVHRLADQRDHGISVGSGAPMVTHAHAAQAERRHFQTALSQFALLHFKSFRSPLDDRGR